MTRSIFIAATLSFATLIAGAANAATSRGDRQEEKMYVSAKHVDFNNARQTREFYHRLSVVAHTVCASDFSDPLTAEADKMCEREALAGAVKTINAPQLAAIAEKAGLADSVAMAERKN